MRLGTRGAQPITKIAAGVLIKIDDVVNATINREIAGAGRTGIPMTGGRPAEHILRTEIIAREVEARSKAHDLVNFMLS